jgi:hypothetical protein
MKTTTPALLSLLLAASGLLLLISAQDTNGTISEVPTLVLLNQTIPADPLIDTISGNASSGSVDLPPSDAEISVISNDPNGDGIVNADGIDIPNGLVDPIVVANNSSTRTPTNATISI